MLPSSKFGGTCPPQGIFALQKSLRVGCDGGDGGPHRRAGSPRAKKFPEEICFAPSRVSQVCRTPDYRAFKSTQARSTGTTVRTGQLRGARGAAAPLFPKESRENPFEGFSLGNFFLTADAVLLCAAKKNSDSRWRLCRLTDMGCRAGVGKWTSWHVSARITLALAPR